MIDTLSDDSNYNSIFKVLVDLNIEKINLIKISMNSYVNNLDYKKKENKLNEYSDYILSLLMKSFSILYRYEEQIIALLVLIDKAVIYPSIYQTLLINIVFSVYINELVLNPDLKYNIEFISSISNIYKEIEIIISIFNHIFIEIDKQFNTKETIMLYNEINSLPFSEFGELSEIDNDEILNDKIIKLNIMIIKIERFTQDNMNEYFIEYGNEHKFNNKLEYDLLLFNKIIIEYTNNINNNYTYILKFLIYKNLNNLDILMFLEKNSIYHWIDYIAFINGQILDNLLK